MKILLLLLSSFLATALFAQKIDSIYINLYTDSLKKGTYNYINVDGLLSNGRYLPLDSTHLIFSSSAGRFYGNSLWLDKQLTTEKVHVKVILRNKPEIFKEKDIWIKTRENNEPLKTAAQVLEEMGGKPSRKKGSKH